MAYVPPHKRNSADGARPLPESLVLPFKQKLNVQRRKKPWAQMIVYARVSFTRWWVVGSMEDDHVPESMRLEPTSIALFEHETDEKPFVLVKSDPPPTAEHEDLNATDKSPWISIADKVHPILISSFESYKSDAEEVTSQQFALSPSLVIRIGKILLHGNKQFPATLENLKLDGWRKTRRIFHTNLPGEFAEEVVHAVVPKIGSYLLTEKEHYFIKVKDETQSAATYSCKCYLAKESNELKVHKIYSNQVRHLVANTSSVDKDLDLRIMLSRKQTHAKIQDEINEAILSLAAAGTIDPGTKGGMRWAWGKKTFADRFTIVGSWHTKHRKFKFGELDMSLYVRWVNRVDYVSSKGGISHEITLKMDRIRDWMKDECLNEDTVSETLKKAVELTWENLLDCRYPLQ